MCKEDIRLARHASPGTSYGPAVPASETQILTANPNRYSLGGAIGYSALVGRNISAMLAVKVAGRYVPVLTFSPDAQGGVVNINDVGSLICEAIWYVSNGAEVPTALYVGDTVFTKELEAI